VGGWSPRPHLVEPVTQGRFLEPETPAVTQAAIRVPCADNLGPEVHVVVSESWTVVLLIVTPMLRSTKPLSSVVNTGFEKAATPVRVTPTGGV
jgi:hypothetical protein